MPPTESNATISPEGWVDRYRILHPRYERLTFKLRGLLEDLLGEAAIKFQVVEARAKTIEGFREKLGREGKTYSNPLEEVTDLAGGRIIVYYERDIATVSDLVDAQFSVDPSRSIDKSTALAPDQFGYLSVHKIVRLSNARAALPEWRPFRDLVAEIQIRSVLQHSWAAISHALDYKHESDVPTQFRRRLIRVSGLLELADQEFGALRNEQADFSRTVAASVSHGDLNVPIDATALIEFAGRSTTLDELARAAVAANFTIMQGTPKSPSHGPSQLVRAASLFDLKTIAEIQATLEQALPKAKPFFKAFMELRRNKTSSTSGSREHLAAVAVAAIKGRRTPTEKLQEIGWSDTYAERIQAAATRAYGED